MMMIVMRMISICLLPLLNHTDTITLWILFQAWQYSKGQQSAILASSMVTSLINYKSCNCNVLTLKSDILRSGRVPMIMMIDGMILRHVFYIRIRVLGRTHCLEFRKINFKLRLLVASYGLCRLCIYPPGAQRQRNRWQPEHLKWHSRWSWNLIALIVKKKYNVRDS